MDTHFKEFYYLLEKDNKYKLIEMRLRYKKTLLKFLKNECPKLKEDLELMIKNYHLKNNV